MVPWKTLYSRCTAPPIFMAIASIVSLLTPIISPGVPWRDEARRGRVCDSSKVFNAYSVGERGIRDRMEFSEPKKKRFKLKGILSLAER
jgi:hypothetical protein